MKKFSFGLIIFIIVAAIVGSSWELPTNGDTRKGDSPVEQAIEDVAEDDYDYEDQASMNMAHSQYCQEYNDSIETAFQALIGAYPQYKEELEREGTAWKKYQDAVQNVAKCVDYGSSTPMYVNDVLILGIILRDVSFHNILRHAQGKTVSSCVTIFTDKMITDAYSAFIDAVGNNDYLEDRDTYQASLRKEQQCWNEWMGCRKSVSMMLAADLKMVYDDCTNLTRRTKLLQLKNQNNGLGITSGEILKCVLPDACSDKSLLEYPGFGVVWAKHSENTDWYPNFDY